MALLLLLLALMTPALVALLLLALLLLSLPLSPLPNASDAAGLSAQPLQDWQAALPLPALTRGFSLLVLVLPALPPLSYPVSTCADVVVTLLASGEPPVPPAALSWKLRPVAAPHLRTPM